MSKRRNISTLLLLLVLALSLSNAIASAQQSPQNPDEEPTVRVTTSLVQVDAVVVDEKGRPVTDLKADDFEIYEDGKLQPITNFLFVSGKNGENRNNDRTALNKNIGRSPVTTPSRLRPEDLRRTIAIIVDANTSIENLFRIKRSLKRFVDEKIEPGDVAAIFYSGKDVGSLLQFTADKRQLYRQINNLNLNLSPIALASASASTAQDFNRAGNDKPFRVGTLGAVNSIIEGFRNVPGRKAVVLFYDGQPLFDQAAASSYAVTDTFKVIKKLADIANRASVTVYCIDTNGLTVDTDTKINTGGNTQDNRLQPGQEPSTSINFDEPVSYEPEARTGLGSFSSLGSRPLSRELATQTGGVFIRNTNDLSLALERILADQEDYYLLGYAPDEDTFNAQAKDRGKFLNVKVKVKRPGLTVRSRQTFYREPDAEKRNRPLTVIEKLTYALTLPLASDGVKLQMNSFFVKPNNQAAIRSFIYIDGNSITFNKGKDDTYTGSIDIMAAILDENGLPIENLQKTQTVEVKESAYQQILKNGLISDIYFPMKKHVATQFRIAVRDVASGKIGSASQYVEVPDKVNKNFGLSGIVLSSSELNLFKDKVAPLRTFMAKPPTEKLSEGEIPLDLLLRSYPSGTELKYSYQIYNAKLDGGKRPSVSAQFQLFRDGQEVLSGPVEPISQKEGNPQKITVTQKLKLTPDLKPGNYYLQIKVTDRLEKDSVLIQGIDFEITNP